MSEEIEAGRARGGRGGPRPLVTCVIATRNRRAALVEALESLRLQRGVTVEIVVLDDASSDDTEEYVRSSFPEVRLVRFETRQERLVLRNSGIAGAGSEFVLVLDHDCYLADENTIRNALERFDDPDIAVVCIPVIEPFRPRPGLKPGPIACAGAELGAFMAGASVFRKSAFTATGGYREALVHHHEERDLAVRLLDRGYRFVYAGGNPLVHTVHPKRDADEQLRGYLRNMVLIPFLNFPFPFSILHMISGSVRVLSVSFSNRPWGVRVRGVLAGWLDCLSCRKDRRSVSFRAYFRHRRLPRHRPEGFAGAIPTRLGARVAADVG